jgi:hypothetical protein
MTTTYAERNQGRDYDIVGQKLSVPFVVTGAFNEAISNAVALAASNPFRQGLWRQNITSTHQGNGCWHGTIHYGPYQTAVGTYRLNYDTTGGTLRVTHSKAMRAKYWNAAYPEPPETRAIGKQPDGSVDGADIVIPALKLTWTFRHPLGAMPLSRIKQLARFTGYTNNDTWMTFEPGELLYLGSTGSQGSDTEADVAYNFAASQNATGLTIGSIAGIAKKGHDYLDVQWCDEVVGGVDTKDAKYAYTHRVYDETSFQTLMGF